jgi:4'-phosphopantetheinyl transferase
MMTAGARRPVDPGASLSADTCHVWALALSHVPPRLRQSGVFTADEIDRADRFRNLADGDAWLLSRGLLRTVLAGYCATEPSALRFLRLCRWCGADHGKPTVEGSPVRFSASHTGRVTVVAVVADADVGVDAESTSVDLELLDFIASDAERRVHDATPPSRQEAWRRSVWTRKEAVVKATGQGLVFPLQQVSVEAGSGAVVTCADQDWWIADVPLEGASSALATPFPVTLRRSVETTCAAFGSEFEGVVHEYARRPR